MKEETVQSDQIEKFLLLRCGGEFFLLEASRVRRVIDHLSIYESPFRAKGMLGLARFGGEPLVVLSLAALASGTPNHRYVDPTVVVVDTLESEQHAGLGFAVDDALEILSLGNDGLHTKGDRLFSEPISVGDRQARRVHLDVVVGPGKFADYQETIQPKE